MLSRDHFQWLRKLPIHSNKGCWIDDGQVVALRMMMLGNDPIVVVILHVKLHAYILP